MSLAVGGRLQFFFFSSSVLLQGFLSALMAWQLVFMRTTDPRERKAKTTMSFITYPQKSNTVICTISHWLYRKTLSLPAGGEDLQAPFWRLATTVTHGQPAIQHSVLQWWQQGQRQQPWCHPAILLLQPRLQTPFKSCLFSKLAPPASCGFCWFLHPYKALVLLKTTRLVSVVCNQEP